jgi:hypothetical protein
MPPPTSYLEANIDVFPTFGDDTSKEESGTYVQSEGAFRGFAELNNVTHNLILESGEILIFENGIPLEL